MKQKAGTGELLAWAFYDWANSAFVTVIQTFVFAAYFVRSVAENETVGTNIWGNTLSVVGLVTAVCGPIIGAVADQRGRRKPFIAAFMLLCVTATALLWFIRPSADYVLPAVILVALASWGFEFSVIFYNAMLPALADDDHIGRWSGWGWGLGYAGGLLCLVAALFGFVHERSLFKLDTASAAHVRITFVLTAVWFLVFSLPLFLFTPGEKSHGKSVSEAVREGLRQVWDTIRRIREYSVILRFLIARMIYIDGLATVFAFGGVYAAGTFDMNPQQVLMFGIAMNVTAGLGAALFAFLDDKLGSRNTVLLSLGCVIATATGILLVKSLLWFWIIGLVLGIFVGPVQAASRSYLSRAAPEALRNQMFGLYALSGKATSFLGPLLVGWLTFFSGSQRVGMSAILLFFLVGFGIMLTVPAQR